MRQDANNNGEIVGATFGAQLQHKLLKHLAAEDIKGPKDTEEVKDTKKTEETKYLYYPWFDEPDGYYGDMYLGKHLKIEECEENFLYPAMLQEIYNNKKKTPNKGEQSDNTEESDNNSGSVDDETIKNGAFHIDLIAYQSKNTGSPYISAIWEYNAQKEWLPSQKKALDVLNSWVQEIESEEHSERVFYIRCAKYHVLRRILATLKDSGIARETLVEHGCAPSSAQAKTKLTLNTIRSVFWPEIAEEGGYFTVNNERARDYSPIGS